jgi:hypothetical protein
MHFYDWHMQTQKLLMSYNKFHELLILLDKGSLKTLTVKEKQAIFKPRDSSILDTSRGRSRSRARTPQKTKEKEPKPIVRQHK